MFAKQKLENTDRGLPKDYKDLRIVGWKFQC